MALRIIAGIRHSQALGCILGCDLACEASREETMPLSLEHLTKLITGSSFRHCVHFPSGTLLFLSAPLQVS